VILGPWGCSLLQQMSVGTSKVQTETLHQRHANTTVTRTDSRGTRSEPLQWEFATSRWHWCTELTALMSSVVTVNSRSVRQAAKNCRQNRHTTWPLVSISAAWVTSPTQSHSRTHPLTNSHNLTLRHTLTKLPSLGSHVRLKSLSPTHTISLSHSPNLIHTLNCHALSLSSLLSLSTLCKSHQPWRRTKPAHPLLPVSNRRTCGPPGQATCCVLRSPKATVLR